MSAPDHGAGQACGRTSPVGTSDLLYEVFANSDFMDQR